MSRASCVGVLATIAAGAMVLVGTSSAARPESARAFVAKAQTRGFVTQVGPRNYAGPNCPGRGWRCTTSLNVVQVATADGRNVAECRGPGLITGPGTSEDANCVFEQAGPSNTARCIQRSTAPDVVQVCDITQTGAENHAFVTQIVKTSAGSDQDVQQIAHVTQGPGGSDTAASNDLHLGQSVKQKTKTAGVAQTQDAYQSAIVVQTAKGGGKNLSVVNQSQSQQATNGLTQAQDALTSLPSGVTDCASGSLAAPHACANVSQTSQDGKNQNNLGQTIAQNEKSNVATDQDQGSFNGGLEGRVHQVTVGGSSENHAKQRKSQKQVGPSTSEQRQVDPISCCGFFSQLGGSGNSENIDQSSSLSATDPTDQDSTLTGTSNTPSGSCAITQHAKVNDAQETNSASFSPSCPSVTLVTTCESGTVTEGNPECTAFPPSFEVCVECIEGPGFRIRRN